MVLFVFASPKQIEPLTTWNYHSFHPPGSYCTLLQRAYVLTSPTHYCRVVRYMYQASDFQNKSDFQCIRKPPKFIWWSQTNHWKLQHFPTEDPNKTLFSSPFQWFNQFNPPRFMAKSNFLLPPKKIAGGAERLSLAEKWPLWSTL